MNDCEKLKRLAELSAWPVNDGRSKVLRLLEMFKLLPEKNQDGYIKFLQNEVENDAKQESNG